MYLVDLFNYCLLHSTPLDPTLLHFTPHSPLPTPIFSTPHYPLPISHSPLHYLAGDARPLPVLWHGRGGASRDSGAHEEVRRVRAWVRALYPLTNVAMALTLNRVVLLTIVAGWLSRVVTK